MLAFQATTVPDVRSVSLAQASVIYCSSLYGAFHAEVGDDHYTNKRLTLMSGNRITPHRSLVVFRELGREMPACWWG